MRKAILILVLATASIVKAQSTTVSATVTDTDSLVWSNAVVTFTFIPNPVDTVLSHYSWTGGTLAYQFSTTTNGSGTLSISIPDNGTITPAQSQWLVTICPNASSGCASVKLTITGASQSITTALNAIAQGPRFPVTTSGYGYGTVEVNNNPKPGATFFNTTTATTQTFGLSGWVSGAAGAGAPTNLCSLVTLPSGTTCSGGNITIGTPAASVLISGIPAGYHNLVVDYSGIDSGGANFLQVAFNADSAAHYSWSRTGFSAANGGVPGTATLCQIGAVGASAGTAPGGGWFRIAQYDSTTQAKIGSGQGSEASDPGQFNFWCGWNQNTTAITSITFTLAGGGNLSGALTIQGTN